VGVCPSPLPIASVTLLVASPLGSVQLCGRVLCWVFMVQLSDGKSTHLDFMGQIRGSIFGARKVGTKSCSKM